MSWSVNQLGGWWAGHLIGQGTITLCIRKTVRHLLMYSVINLLDTVNAICFLISSNPPVPCPAGMYSLGGRFENCTACPAGNACPDPAGAPVACTGGKHPFDNYSNGCCSQLLS